MRQSPSDTRGAKASPVKSLDTNVVLRLLVGDVPEQAAKIEDMLAAAKPNSFAVADAVFFECAWVLSGPLYGFGRSMVGDMLLQVAGIGQVSCNRTMLRQAIPRYVQNKAISFMDSCLVTYAEINNATPLLTFDKHLAKAVPELAEEL